MFRITEDPSSGSLVQYSAKITRMVLSRPLTWTWSVLWQHIVTVIRYNKGGLFWKQIDSQSNMKREKKL